MERVFACMSDASLSQRVTPDGRSLGQIAWHLAITLREMMEQTGLGITGPADDAPLPATVREIADAYLASASTIQKGVPEQWTDASLEDDLPMYGEVWKRGKALQALIQHQVHHRGQMTVLMRQAGLRVPGLFGPSREEWAQYNMPAPW